MKSDNELIAEFMGFKYYADYGHHRDVYYEEAVIDPADPDFVQTPHWNDSWDWLMPVVEKIHKLWEQYPIVDWQNDKEMFHFTEVVAIPVSEKIEVVYKAVVEFIKWYNSAKPQTP